MMWDGLCAILSLIPVTALIPILSIVLPLCVVLKPTLVLVSVVVALGVGPILVCLIPGIFSLILLRWWMPLPDQIIGDLSFADFLDSAITQREM
jgi:hypothetical protein